MLIQLMLNTERGIKCSRSKCNFHFYIIKYIFKLDIKFINKLKIKKLINEEFNTLLRINKIFIIKNNNNKKWNQYLIFKTEI